GLACGPAESAGRHDGAFARRVATAIRPFCGIDGPPAVASGLASQRSSRPGFVAAFCRTGRRARVAAARALARALLRELLRQVERRVAPGTGERGKPGAYVGVGNRGRLHRTELSPRLRGRGSCRELL